MGVLDKKVLGGPLSKFTLSREVLGGGLGGKPCLEVNLHQSAPGFGSDLSHLGARPNQGGARLRQMLLKLDIRIGHTYFQSLEIPLMPFWFMN